ncbi:g325 [Coccomyxa viridis]|uniref:G325 protein n=1 Tax=Coccomyxa viridis TaxID=1274662 RepID=A0ABP1FHE9_9CHLO
MTENGPGVPEERERLGWLAGSTMQPRKRRMIEGVGNRGLLDMKAVLYKEQQEAEQASRDPVFAAERQSRRTVGLDVSKLKGRNQGVDQRNMQDMQHVKTAQDKLDESRAALERKSQLYERLAAGQYNDADELYNVDFLQKGTLEDERHSMQHEAANRAQHASSDAPIDTAAGLVSSAGMTNRGMERERERREWEQSELQDLDDLQAKHARIDERLEAFERIQEEARRAGEEAAFRKQQKGQQAKQDRERLKAEFIKKQVAAKLAARAAKPSARTGS